MYKNPEYSYESTAYKSTTNKYNVNLLESDSPTYYPSTKPTTPTKLRDSKIRKNIWSQIFN